MNARHGTALLLPAVAVVTILLIVPLLLVGDESLRLFVSGRVGSAHDAPLTLQNYAELLRAAYGRYFADTFRLSLIASVLAVVLAYPIGYKVAREYRPRVRRAWIAFLVVMLFLSILIRVYAVSLATGSSGFCTVSFPWRRSCCSLRCRRSTRDLSRQRRRLARRPGRRTRPSPYPSPRAAC